MTPDDANEDHMQVKTARQLLDEWAVAGEERAWLSEVMAAAAAACGSAAADAAKHPEAATAALWSRLGEVGVFELAGEGTVRALETALIGYALGTQRAPGPLAASVMAACALEGADAEAVRAGAVRVAAGADGVFSWLSDEDAIVLDLSGHRLRRVTVADVSAQRGLAGEPLARAKVTAAWPVAVGDGPLALGGLASAGYLCGIAEQILALAVTYAAERRQFGKPILSYQDVGHRLADARAALGASEQLLHIAARTVAAEPDGPRGLPLAARALGSAAQSAGTVSRIAHQTFGAYGFTDEAPLAVLVTRVHDLIAGAPGKHLARSSVARALTEHDGRLQPVLLDAADCLLTGEERAFREEVRAFAGEHRAQGAGAQYFRITEEDDAGVEALHRELGARGWLSLGWPVEHGGAAASPALELLLWDTMAEARLGRPSLGATVVAGAIMRYGSEELRAEYLPGLGRGELLFALGISEPEAGSDLKNVRLAATPTGGGFVLQGMKVWTSNAHRATHLFVLARVTDGIRDDPGYSVFVVPMSTSGLRVRGIRTLDGARLNEVHFESVAVPGGNLVGSVGGGFGVLGAAFEKERHLQFLPGRLRRDLADVAGWLDATGSVPRAVLEHELTPLVERVTECEATALNLARQRDPQRSSQLAAQHKLRWGETCQLINRLPFELGLPAAAFGDEAVGHAWKQSLNETIGGGTSEMMRRTIVRDWLGR